MKALARIKEDIDFVKSMNDIIEALKTTALMQFRIFQNRQKTNALFFKEIENTFNYLQIKGVDSVYIKERVNSPTVIVAVTSDEGFMGELNSLVINSALDLRKGVDDEILVIGEQGTHILSENNEKFSFFPGISEKITADELSRVRNYLTKVYSEKFGKIIVIYPEFISLTQQKISKIFLLPFTTPKTVSQSKPMSIEDLIIEPKKEMVIDALVELWMRFRLQEIFVSSKQSEYAARIMHLEGSSQELGSLQKKIQFDYFKTSHALSDKTIREVMVSKKILSNG